MSSAKYLPAVVVQAMVFGNADGNSGTGVGFTRSPITGERGMVVDFTPQGQFEDVIDGMHETLQTDAFERWNAGIALALRTHAETLERHFKDMQNFIFVVEGGKLYLLETNDAKRSTEASLKVAIDFVSEGINSGQEALVELDARH